MSVDFFKNCRNAMKPLHLTSGAAGSDLFSTSKQTLHRGETAAISFELCMKIPKGFFGLISGRSSIALKGVMTHVGIIDSDYYGVGKIILTNIGPKPFEIKCRDRVGQITLIRYSKANWVNADNFKIEAIEWNNSENKHAGCGSTGV